MKTLGNFCCLLFLFSFPALWAQSPPPPPTPGEIHNGGFENGLNGWTVEGSVASGNPQHLYFGYVSPTEGENYAYFGFNNDSGAIRQSLSLESGQSYELAFDFNSAGDPDRTGALRVEIRSGPTLLLETNFFKAADNASVRPWNNLSMVFRVPESASDVEIRFADVSPFNGTAVDIMLDRVRLGPTLETGLKNGSFESGLASWSTQGAVDAGNPTNISWNVFQPSHGSSYAYLGHDGQGGAKLFQTVGLTGGKTYKLSFDFNCWGDPGQMAGVEAAVFAGGQPLAGAQFLKEAHNSQEQIWERHAVIFNLPAEITEVEIRFTDISPNSGYASDIAIDDVQLAVTTTPEDSLLKNGSFESSLDHWNPQGSVAAGNPQELYYGLLSPTDGENYAYFGHFDDPGSSIRQTVSVTPGTIYELGFDFNSVGDPGRRGGLKVEVFSGSALLLTTNFFKSADNASPRPWDQLTVHFLVPREANQVEVRFLDVSPDDGTAVDIMLDGVRLKLSTRTEPPPPPRTGIQNPSFELGLESWQTRGDVGAGNPTNISWNVLQPSHGTNYAYLGYKNQGGATLFQSMQLEAGGDYTLTFDYNCWGDPGRLGVLEASFNCDGKVLAIGRFQKSAHNNRQQIWETHSLFFRVPAGTGIVELKFLDMSPENGMAVDLALDNLHLKKGSPPPFISEIRPQEIWEDIPSSVFFTVEVSGGDASEIQVEAKSLNHELLRVSSIRGSGTKRDLMLNPTLNNWGSTEVLVFADYQGVRSTRSFRVKILPVNDKPHISEIQDVTIPENTQTEPIPFTIGDVDNDVRSLKLRATSSNKNLVPDQNIKLGGEAAKRNLVITPTKDQAGTTEISVIVSDGELTAEETFILTVTTERPRLYYVYADPYLGLWWDPEVTGYVLQASLDVELEVLGNGTKSRVWVVVPSVGNEAIIPLPQEMQFFRLVKE